ncbi:MAG: hypothetical protein JEZ14_15085 [Marinilabiliaceae bacterium]|nr:hypothetical protein [Marinilabiliaceae bacterium]
MKPMLDKISTVLPPTTGGVIGAVVKGAHSIAELNIERYVDVAISAAIGATVGYVIKLVLDWIKNKVRCQKSKK